VLYPLKRDWTSRVLNRIQKGKNIVVEFQEDGQAEVIVIRQYTTKTSDITQTRKVAKIYLLRPLRLQELYLKQTEWFVRGDFDNEPDITTAFVQSHIGDGKAYFKEA